MNAERLLKLADVLERDAYQLHGVKFDLLSIITVDDPKLGPGMNCGTMACALGIWALCGEFEGVTISRVERTTGKDFDVEYQNTTNRDAAEIYFDISGDVSAWLFLNQYYTGLPTEGEAGERAVAARIRAFVAGKEAPPVIE